MARPLDGKIAEILKSFGFGKAAVWDCHGTWVVYHRVLETIAAKAGIEFDNPFVLEANGKEKCVALCVAGTNADGKSEWSIGEAAPGNNKNAYPFAMAEKRGKDRVILKLIGLHGLAYSEDEADAFEPPADKPLIMGPLTKTKLEAALREFVGQLGECEDLDSLAGLLEAYKGPVGQCEMEHPTWWWGKDDTMGLKDRIEAVRSNLEQHEQTPLDGG